MPRLIFKDDRDSLIGRGCHVTTAHMRPEMALIFYTVGVEAPKELQSGHVTFSEGWRLPRSDERDLHAELRAVDVSFNYDDNEDWIALSDAARESRVQAWAARVRVRLGPDYTVVVHGSGRNRHMHIELDPR